MIDLTTNFIDLNLMNVMYLFFVGLIGGLVSGFIGSGGAFVLTPGMMSIGVPGLVAVATNMCHKFPKALVGAVKRAKFGQVDVKLGLVMGASAEVGVLVGAHIQEYIKKTFGDAGSNLYVSAAFVIVLSIVGTYVLFDAMKTKNNNKTNKAEEITKIAKWVRSVNIPGTMVYFKSLGGKVSFLFTIPLGFATGILASTIAVGGFIGVPGLMYVLGAPAIMASATELVIAFVMGLLGSLKYAMGGFVDIRLAMIILAGSLFGVQLGAIGTTYVKDYMIKIVMGVIMLIVLVSRGLMVPVYMGQLGLISPLSDNTVTMLKTISFITMVAALLIGALIICAALIKGMRAERKLNKLAEFEVSTTALK